MQTCKARARRAGALALTTAVIATGVLTVTTGASAEHDTGPVDLDAAARFLVLAGSEVTNTGPTRVTGGSVGVSEGTSITGFAPTGPGVVVLPGMVESDTDQAAAGKLALSRAYDDLSGRSQDGPVRGPELGGLRLTRGVYATAPGVATVTGTLTLDAQGDPNAVFIFQVPSALDVASGSQILLVGEAQACNVFFRVPSQATIGANARFAGNVLASTAVVAQTGASINGRLLASTAEVTLDSNSISISPCIDGGTTTSTTDASTTSTTDGSTTSTSGPTTTVAPTSTTTGPITTVAPTTSTTGPTGSTTSTTAATTAPPATTTSTTRPPGVPGVVGPPRTGGAPPAPAGSPWSGVAATALLSTAGALGMVLHRRERTAHVELPVE